MTRQRRLLPRTSRAAARLAAAGVSVAVVASTAVITLGAGMSSAAGPPDVAFVRAPSDTVTTEVDTDEHTLKIAASPTTDLPPTNAHITVRGTGFDTDSDLWIAVCQDDGAAPAALLHCLGGAIPDQNATTAWGVVTRPGRSKYAGPVVTRWHGHGSFELTLQIPTAWDQFANCMAAPCSVYARSAHDDNVIDGLRIPVSFVDVSDQPTTTTTSPPPPTTEIIGHAPTTVAPEIVQSTAITPGGKQTVLFAGFTPGEDVDVTLFSDPIVLPKVRADDSGNVRIEFDVPDDLPPGQHLVEAVGRQSNRVGIAPFAVTAPTTSTESSSTATTNDTDKDGSTTSDAVSTVTEHTDGGDESSAIDSAATDGEVAGGVGTAADAIGTDNSAVAGVVGSTAPLSTVSSVAVPGQALGAAAAATTATTPIDDGTDGSQTSADGSRLLWLWIVLVALVLIALIAGVIVMVRSRRVRDGRQHAVASVESYGRGNDGTLVGGGADPDAVSDRDRGADRSSGWTAPAWSEPRYGEHALLSGSYDRPDEPPTPAERPTEVVDDRAARPIPSDASDGPAVPPLTPEAHADPHTEQWQPDFTPGHPVDADDPALEDLDGPPPDAPSDESPESDSPPDPPPGGKHRSD